MTKIYAALHEDIAEGFVWLTHDFSARSVVKITNKDNGRRIYCEALQFEKNFLKHYNRTGSGRVAVADPTVSAVMNHWYRARLGGLETQKEYPLDVTEAWRPWGKLRACTGHPQVIVRVATRLGLIGIALGFLSLCLTETVQSVVKETLSRFSQTPPKPTALSLTIEGVLAWRVTYGDLLGKPREAVIERFGIPQKEEGKTLSWDSSAKTGDRDVVVVFTSEQKDGIASAVKVFAREAELLDAADLLKKAPMFRFSTGTYTDSLLNYLAAETRDGRNTFQFDVSEGGTKFRAMAFTEK